MNTPTIPESIEYVLNKLDSVTLLQGTAGTKPRGNFEKELVRKIGKTRKLLQEAGNGNCLISIDGGVSYENAPVFKKAGADMLVLGSNTIYKKGSDTESQIRKLREILA